MEQNSELSLPLTVQGPCCKLFLHEYIFEIAGQETVKAEDVQSGGEVSVTLVAGQSRKFSGVI